MLKSIDLQLKIAIPLLNELDNFPTLIECIAYQTQSNFKVYFCVNQPDDWWGDLSQIDKCKNNQKTIQYIKENVLFPYEIIDKSSLGHGWKGKKLGVGWARKTLFDHILETANDDDIIISLDADTTFSKEYFKSVERNLQENPSAPAVAVPYYHPLCGQEAEDRAILRYEIYMRHYLISLYQIESPYAFSALGSAIAIPAWAVRKIGGITPKKSGEDFYLLQKLVKFRPILNWNTEKVFPAARFSDRVFFGTGPAMIKGNAGDWSSYPIYNAQMFQEIKSFYKLIPTLFQHNIDTPVDGVFGDQKTCFEIWDLLRKNNNDLPHFTKAVHDKFDGLRILQFLKQNSLVSNLSNEERLIYFLDNISLKVSKPTFNRNFSFLKSSISDLNKIRDYLCLIEDEYRQTAIKQYGE